MAVTWILFVKQRGISPLAAGQWGAYLAFYAGFWTINNLYVDVLGLFSRNITVF